ncbi:hypothetical protein MHTCC0001_08510 [Flavobacteriaceae bacterium MHTCC 0001]
MRTGISIIIILFLSISLTAQRPIIPGQNHLYRFLEDPSFTSVNDQYNMTGLLQASDSDIAETSQYIAAQLAFFNNFALGIDYNKHSYDTQRYSQIALNSRFRFNFDDYYHYFNIGLSLGTDKLYERESSRENDILTTYRLSAHYTNYNLTIGGFVNYYPFKNDIITDGFAALSRGKGYVGYASYNIALSDNFRVTPMVRYNSFSDLDFFEGIALLNYKGNGELAIAYKNDYSINAAASAKFFKRLKVSYSYEKAIGSQTFSDVHAIGLSVDLVAEATDIPEWLVNVKRNRIKIHNQRYKKPKPEETPAIEEVKPEIAETKIDTVTSTKQVPKEITYPAPMSEDDPEDTVGDYLKPGYYIILGSFKKVENANKAVEKLKAKGYYARTGKKPNDDFNYVYVDRYTDLEIAKERTNLKQTEKGFKKVWLLRIK